MPGRASVGEVALLTDLLPYLVDAKTLTTGSDIGIRLGGTHHAIVCRTTELISKRAIALGGRALATDRKGRVTILIIGNNGLILSRYAVIGANSNVHASSRKRKNNPNVHNNKHKPHPRKKVPPRNKDVEPHRPQNKTPVVLISSARPRNSDVGLINKCHPGVRGLKKPHFRGKRRRPRKSDVALMNNCHPLPPDVENSNCSRRNPKPRNSDVSLIKNGHPVPHKVNKNPNKNNSSSFGFCNAGDTMITLNRNAQVRVVNYGIAASTRCTGTIFSTSSTRVIVARNVSVSASGNSDHKLFTAYTNGVATANPIIVGAGNPRYTPLTASHNKKAMVMNRGNAASIDILGTTNRNDPYVCSANSVATCGTANASRISRAVIVRNGGAVAVSRYGFANGDPGRNNVVLCRDVDNSTAIKRDHLRVASYAVHSLDRATVFLIAGAGAIIIYSGYAFLSPRNGRVKRSCPLIAYHGYGASKRG